MDIEAMKIPHAFRLMPNHLHDDRGSFFESWRQDAISEAIGQPFVVRQANYSISRRNTIRGFHGAVTPPGQAKLVTCVRGAVLDVVIDLRIGSPTYGVVEVTEQDEVSGIGVYVAEGLGHAFLALTEGACMNYLCSTEYAPGTMVDIQPLDPEIDVPWNLSAPPILSAKDAAAPTLAEAAAAGLLPTYDECLALYDSQRRQVLSV